MPNSIDKDKNWEQYNEGNKDNEHKMEGKTEGEWEKETYGKLE